MNNASIRKFDTSATFACIGSLVFWSLGPIFIKFLTGYLDLWTQNMLRYLAACLFWLPFLLFTVKKKRIENKVWRKAALPAGANIVMQSLWAGAFYYIGPAFVVLLSKFSVIWIAAFSFVFFADERPLVKSKRFWLGMVLSIIGVVGVIVGKEDFSASKTTMGIVVALSAAFMWAVYTISVKIAFKDIDSRSGFSVVSIYTTVGLCVIALSVGDVQDCIKMGAWPWACVVISGITSIALSHVLYYAAIRRIGATIPSLMLLSTPFTVLVISNVFFGEFLNLPQWLFGLVLLAGSALAIWAQQHLTPPLGAAGLKPASNNTAGEST
jgi:drug/metabolite transporter (DMT)-like permease